MANYVNTDSSLPRSLDVQISVSTPSAETRTNLSVLCFVDEDLGFLPNANRVRFYSSLAAVTTDFATNTNAYRAATAFFAQSPRANVMAIGEAFTGAQSALLVSGAVTAAELVAIRLITTGSMVISVDGVAKTLSSLDFTGVTTLTGVAGVLQAALTAGSVGATCTVKTLPGGDQRLAFTTTSTGSTATLSYPIAHSSGVFIGEVLNFTAAAGGSVMNGYTPTDIAGEMANIKAAANASDIYIYGWVLSQDLRDVATQTLAAAWVLGQTAIGAFTTNDPLALDPTYTTDIGSVLEATANKRAIAVYHDVINRYPDISILAYMLSVNYQLQDSTVTTKFKQLPGIETVQLTETQWIALKAKGYNTYTMIGNSSRTFRDGVTESATFYIDSVINIDNFVEDLSVAIYNVFLRNKKVPYTRMGQMLLVDACRDVGFQYTYNGTFADRAIADTTKKSGTTILPAVAINPTPISQMSVADRASRIGPPIALIVQEAGAIHSVSIAVEVVP